MRTTDVYLPVTYKGADRYVLCYYCSATTVLSSTTLDRSSVYLSVAKNLIKGKRPTTRYSNCHLYCSENANTE